MARSRRSPPAKKSARRSRNGQRARRSGKRCSRKSRGSSSFMKYLKDKLYSGKGKKNRNEMVEAAKEVPPALPPESAPTPKLSIAGDASTAKIDQKLSSAIREAIGEIQKLIDSTEEAQERALDKLIGVIGNLPKVLNNRLQGQAAIDSDAKQKFGEVWTAAGGAFMLDELNDGADIGSLKEYRISKEKQEEYRARLQKIQQLLTCAKLE